MTYVAIDLGASGGRYIFFEIKDGKLVEETVYRFSNKPQLNDEGRLVWDWKYLFENIVKGLKEVKLKKGGVDFVGIDTWAVDYALLDKDDELIHDIYSYRDSNNDKLCTPVHDLISFEELYSRTGIQFQTFNTIYRLYDDKVKGFIKEDTQFLMLPDFFNFLLTGVKRQEFTNATSTGLVNSKTKEWDEEIIEKLGIERSLFKPLTSPGTLLSKVKPEIEMEIGYSPTVVCVVSHDTASAVVGSGVNYDEPYISSGTWSLLGIRSKESRTDGKSMSLNYSNEGDVELGTRYQKNIMGLWIIQQLRHDLNDRYSFQELVELASKSKTDIVFDVNDQELLAPKSMKEALEKKVGKIPIGEMSYSIFHSLALSYKKSLDELESITGVKYKKLNIIGGGCQNTLLNKLTKEECGIDVYCGPIEATAIGNAVAMLVATKEVESLDEARRLVKDSFDISEVNL